MNINEEKEKILLKYSSKISAYFIILAVLGFGILLVPFAFEGSNTPNYGIVGDTVGGLLNPIIAIPATILTFLAFWVQYKANEQQKLDLSEQKERELVGRFEDRFFEMINIHRENVNQVSYTKFDVESDEKLKAENRKVYRLIFKEFIECLHEVRRYSNSLNPDDYLHPTYKLKVESLIKKVNPKINIIDFITIDIAYCILFYGLSEEGEIILRSIFRNRYNDTYYFKLLKYMQLKPKRENKDLYKKWEEIHELNHIDRITILDELYNYNKGTNPNKNISVVSKQYLIEKKYSKYYGGHQHRLSHYFRHLFQCFKYLTNQRLLEKKEKYFYGKILRAQISTYEQALIFINSITNLGMNWEYSSKYDNEDKLKGNELIEKQNEFKFITNYQLIKNLPGSRLMGIEYSLFYPKVKFESMND